MFGALIVYDTSRFALNENDAFSYEAALRAASAHIYYASDAYGAVGSKVRDSGPDIRDTLGWIAKRVRLFGMQEQPAIAIGQIYVCTCGVPVRRVIRVGDPGDGFKIEDFAWSKGVFVVGRLHECTTPLPPITGSGGSRAKAEVSRDAGVRIGVGVARFRRLRSGRQPGRPLSRKHARH